jgi:hypothetical protein
MKLHTLSGNEKERHRRHPYRRVAVVTQALAAALNYFSARLFHISHS